MPDTLPTSTLESLRERVRNATGPDRDLDLDILKGLGKAPADAVWEKPCDEIPGDLLPKKYWERPGYRSAMDEHKAFISRTIRTSSDPDAAAKMIDEREPQWDFKNDPQFGSVPNFTSSIDACVRLIGEVLPPTKFADHKKTEIRLTIGDRSAHVALDRDTFSGEDVSGGFGPTPPLALLSALLTALIEIEKIKQPT